MIKLAPSLLAADMGDLRRQVSYVEEGGAQYLHLDIMDGCFVPNISYGSAVVKDLRSSSRLCFDVHLMVDDPDRYLPQFAAAGADLLCVHAEACAHLHRSLQLIRSLGKAAAVALNPATPLVALEEILAEVDMVLLMSVNPGFGGQAFIPATLSKISRLRAMVKTTGRDIDIEVDGGLGLDNVAGVVRAGANVIVAGTSVFRNKEIPDITIATRKMLEAANNA